LFAVLCQVSGGLLDGLDGGKEEIVADAAKLEHLLAVPTDRR